MKRRFLQFAAVVFALSCAKDATESIPVVCARPGIYTFRVEVRDSDGRGAATGARVEIKKPGYNAASKGWDSVYVYVGESEGGVFDLTVSRPFHQTATSLGITAPEDQCGIWRTTDVAVTIPLIPGAPDIRQVVTLPYGFGFGYGNYRDSLRAKLVAAPNASTRILWFSRDTAVVAVDPNGQLVTRCRKTYGETWAIAYAESDPSKRDSTNVSVLADSNAVRCPRN